MLKDRMQTDLAVRTMVGQSLSQGHAVAMWRLPGSEVTHLITCEKPLLLTDIALEELSSGFLAGPFDSTAEKFFFPGDAHVQIERDTLRVIREPHDLNIAGIRLPAFQWPVRAGVACRETTALEFIQTVRAGLGAIEAGQLEKVVPSRIREIEIPPDGDLLMYFQLLVARYPQALVSLVSSTATGTWLGASPELLVSQDQAGTFRTVALAGTQPYVPGTDIKKISWTQKDIEEQAFVSRYIINCFKKIRLREYEEHGPRTYRAGNLLHLKTEYTVDTKATHFPELASVMLKLLHPTSAVCGMPLEPALAFLRTHEMHARDLYAGFIGPVDIAGGTHLYVNLRCMQWLGGRARLYAGAGVTADSDPAAEWNETEMKINTILKVLHA